MFVSAVISSQNLVVATALNLMSSNGGTMSSKNHDGKNSTPGNKHAKSAVRNIMLVYFALIDFGYELLPQRQWDPYVRTICHKLQQNPASLGAFFVQEYLKMEKKDAASKSTNNTPEKKDVLELDLVAETAKKNFSSGMVYSKKVIDGLDFFLVVPFERFAFKSAAPKHRVAEEVNMPMQKPPQTEVMGPQQANVAEHRKASAEGGPQKKDDEETTPQQAAALGCTGDVITNTGEEEVRNE